MKTILTAAILSCFANSVKAQTYWFDTTFKSYNQVLHISTREYGDDSVSLTAVYGSHVALSDTLDKSGLADIEFPDIDTDGYSDVLLSYLGNNASHLLYLFDPKTNQFREISDYERYPDAVRLKSNSRYFYSYHRAGCADMNWVSDLFTIANFKIVQLGHIYGDGCEEQIIDVYKTIDNDEQKRKLIAKLSYSKYITDFADKWHFLEKYWNTNYQKFQ
jgi:hypothetical protein